MTTASMFLRVAGDVIRARRLVREQARRAGLGLANQTRLATAVSEIARNAITHGGGGEMTVNLETDGKTTITVTITDHGPGIADLEQALTDGWSSTGGLGAGLPGARRLVHTFHIESAPSRGTMVRLGMTA